MADRQRREALPEFRQFSGIARRQCLISVLQRDTGADLQHAVLFVHRFELGDLAEIDHVAQFAQVLGDPQPDVGRTGQQHGGRMVGAQRRQFGHGARHMEVLAMRGVREAVAALQRAQALGQRSAVEGDRRQFDHAARSIDDRAVAGAAAQVAGQRIVDLAARWRAPFLLQVHAKQRHRKARRAKAALRAVAFDQRLLHGMGRAVGLRQVFDREQRLAVERRRELDAGVHGAQRQFAIFQRTDHDGAGAAIALGATFLGAGAAQVLPQVLQDGLRGLHVAQFAQLALVEESDRF